MDVIVNDWDTVSANFGELVSASAHALPARHAFRLTVQAARDELGAEPDPDLAKDCANFVEEIKRQSGTLHRTIYFPTRPGQVPQFFNRLIFYSFFARLSGWAGPIAWLSFPISLLGPTQKDMVKSLESAIQKTCRAHSLELEQLGPVGTSFSPEFNVRTAVFVGSERPVLWDDLERIKTGLSHGYPLICVPSRSVTQLKMSDTPWSF